MYIQYVRMFLSATAHIGWLLGLAILVRSIVSLGVSHMQPGLLLEGVHTRSATSHVASSGYTHQPEVSHRTHSIVVMTTLIIIDTRGRHGEGGARVLNPQPQIWQHIPRYLLRGTNARL